MSTIVPFPQASKDELKGPLTLLHEASVSNIRRKWIYDASKLFAERLVDYAMTHGDSYLAKEASTFATELERLK